MQLSSAYKAQEFAIITPVGAVIGAAGRLLPSHGLLQLQPLCRLWQRRQWRAAVATVAETAACRSAWVKSTRKGRNVSSRSRQQSGSTSIQNTSGIARAGRMV